MPGEVMIRQLEYLAALEREQHFGRAAAACHATQPALSAALRKLERQLGVTIVRRGRRFDGFTPEGLRVVGWAHRILAERDALRVDLDRMRHGLTATVRLGAIPTAIPATPLISEAMAAVHPLARMRIEVLSAPEIVRRLHAYELDAGLTYLPSTPLDGAEAALNGTRTPLDGARTPLDGARAPLDGARTPLDGIRTPLDGARAPLDGARAPLDGARAPLDGARTPLDGARTPLDGTRTPLDGARAPLGGAGPLDETRMLALYRERYALLTPSDGPLAGQESVGWAEAAALPLCALVPDMQNRRIIDAAMAAAGVTHEPVIEAETVDALYAHLATRRWSGVIAHTWLRAFGEPAGMRAIPLSAPGPTPVVGLVTGDHGPSSMVASALLDAVRAADLTQALA